MNGLYYKVARLPHPWTTEGRGGVCPVSSDSCFSLGSCNRMALLVSIFRLRRLGFLVEGEGANLSGLTTIRRYDDDRRNKVGIVSELEHMMKYIKTMSSVKTINTETLDSTQTSTSGNSWSVRDIIQSKRLSPSNSLSRSNSLFDDCVRQRRSS